MREDRTRMAGTMVATHERRLKLGRSGSPVAGFVISCLIFGTASSWQQPAQDEADYPHAC